MSARTLATRGPVSPRQLISSLHRAPFGVGRFSSSTVALEEPHAQTMFHKAVQNNPGPTKPLQFKSARLNTHSATTVGKTQQVAGVKRKLETASGMSSALGSLHDSVYFDENDFDNDSDLDFDSPDPIRPSHSMAKTSQSPTLPKPAASTSQSQAQNDASLADSAVPPSSTPIPWSSSPPWHYLPPQNQQKSRTLPWLADEAKGEERHPETPTPRKETMFWDKSASALKDEQREFRKQNKKRPKNVVEPGPRSRVPEIFLSDEQKAVLEAVVDQGKSIFFTGSAGTGKSVLMREIIKKLQKKYRREPDRVAVTASTGLAACNIEGVTLHSFAGIGLGKESTSQLVKKVRMNQKARNRWLRTKVLIIDEVSMVDGDLFDKLEEIARRIRNNGRPFGGIQLVVTGDFFQLPPVPEGSNREAKFAFAASSWNTAIQHTVLLTRIFRQKDPEFAAMLNEMRLGNISQKTIEGFKKLSRPLQFHDSLEATELFPTRAEVERANNLRMSRLTGDVQTYNAQDSGSIKDVEFRNKLLSNCMAPPTIQLKKGAQVMLIKNMPDDNLVNGSIGRVVAFMDSITYGYINTYEGGFTRGGDEKYSEERINRARARAIEISGGSVNLGRMWPLVAFVQPDGTERHFLCQPETWKIELPDGEVQAQRTQVPLILAWALSIHKAQGQTLPRVKVDLGRVFERGQAYVALSRATSREGLQVTGFDAKKVMVHPKVVEFYRNLGNVSSVLKKKKKNYSSAANFLEDDSGDDYDDDW